MKWQPARDGLNQRVPKRLEQVFLGRQVLEERMDHMVAMSVLPTADLINEEYCRDIDLPRLRDALWEARWVLARAMPFLPCDCRSTDRDCAVCSGSGWISIASAERAGIDVKQWSLHVPAPRSRMPIPEGTAPLTDVRVLGVIGRPAKVEASEALRTDIAKAVIEVGLLDITVVALGELALQLSACHRGTVVEVRGAITIHDWTTSANERHQKFEIEAKELSCPEAATHSIPPDSSKTSLIAGST